MGSLEKARVVLELTKANEMVEYMAQASSKQIERDMSSGGKPEEIKRIMKAVDEVFSKHIPVMIEIVLSGMVSAYSDDELDAMIEFYSSDLGRSIISKQASVNAHNMRELTSYNGVVIYPELQKSVYAVMDQIEAELKAEAEQKE